MGQSGKEGKSQNRQALGTQTKTCSSRLQKTANTDNQLHAMEELRMAITNERMKLIDKVTKLLALANGTNHTAEAESAKRMAAELMAKNNLELSDLLQKEEVFTTERQQHSQSKPARFETMLINVIAKFNEVCLLTRDNWKDKMTLTYIGRTCDIEATLYMIDIVLRQRMVAWKAYRKEYESKYGIKLSKGETYTRWHNGFSAGVRDKLEELTAMSTSKIQEWGLVPVQGDKQALAWYHQHFGKTTPGRASKMKVSQAGRDAGKNVSIHKGIDTQKPGRKYIA